MLYQIKSSIRTLGQAGKNVTTLEGGLCEYVWELEIYFRHNEVGGGHWENLDLDFKILLFVCLVVSCLNQAVVGKVKVIRTGP